MCVQHEVHAYRFPPVVRGGVEGEAGEAQREAVGAGGEDFDKGAVNFFVGGSSQIAVSPGSELSVTILSYVFGGEDGE